MTKAKSEISALIKNKVNELGLLNSAIMPAGNLSEERNHLEKWLANKMHGEMDYMARNIEKRLNPELLVENAKTIIIVLQNYFPKNIQVDSTAPVISKYAFGTDYHFVMKDKLKKLLSFIQTEIQPCNGRPFVDSAPVLERAWAKQAGLGWIGKNSNLISVNHGSFFFIGELILDIELPFDEPKLVRDHCGNCTRCIDACPTKAIVANHVIDARKCISYQTIELKDELDERLKGKFENRVFGCDICQDVCPWNLKSVPHSEPKLTANSKLLQLNKNEWHDIEKPLFNEIFKSSAVKRTGFSGLKEIFSLFVRNKMTKKYEYKTILIKGSQLGVFAEFPFESAKEFGTRKAVRVKATFDGKMYRMNLLPHGNGTHWLHLKKEIRDAIGKTEGDSVNICVEKEKNLPEIEVPEYLQWLLENDLKMMKAFKKIPYSTKKFWMEYIDEPKSNEGKVTRVNRFFEFLMDRKN